ncbi:MAG: hypothetical protein GTN49_10120 [candidate division Zixibacteria bacterium]|nr:hypothetical protein [candidate division Zixibacteria bacterium]
MSASRPLSSPAYLSCSTCPPATNTGPTASGLFHVIYKEYHNLTLSLATLFAFIHVVLALVGLITGMWK